MESLPFVIFTQNNLPKARIDENVIDKMPNAEPYLRPEYIYTQDWAAAIRRKRYVNMDRFDYFKDKKNDPVYEDHDMVFIGLLDDQEDDHVSEREILRERWRKFVGVDIFYPYFKFREIEDWVKDRFSVRFFGMKGRPQFRKNKLLYVFKATF